MGALQTKVPFSVALYLALLIIVWLNTAKAQNYHQNQDHEGDDRDLTSCIGGYVVDQEWLPRDFEAMNSTITFKIAHDLSESVLYVFTTLHTHHVWRASNRSCCHGLFELQLVAPASLKTRRARDDRLMHMNDHQDNERPTKEREAIDRDLKWINMLETAMFLEPMGSHGQHQLRVGLDGSAIIVLLPFNSTASAS